jgi:hypothetical protein
MSAREGAGEAILGISVGLILIAIKAYSSQNADTLIALIQISAILGAIKSYEIVKKIPLKTAIGYFGVTFTIGWRFMPEWERVIQTILLAMYILPKNKK